MTFSGLLKKLRDEQKINAGQADILLDLYERRIIPVHRELRFFLYFGILLIVAGTGLTIKQYFVHLGDIAIQPVGQEVEHGLREPHVSDRLLERHRLRRGR